MDVSSVAVLSPYWAFWEGSVTYDLRAEREDLLARAAAILARRHTITGAVLVDDSENRGDGAADPGALAAASAADAIVVVCTMAAPPGPVLAVLDAVPGRPVVLWAADPAVGVADDLSHGDITGRGATVGAPMIGAALARAGRPFEAVLTSLADPAPALDAVRVAAAAGVVARSTMLRVGEGLPGYSHVLLPPAGTPGAAGFPAVVDVAADEVERRLAGIGDERAHAVTAEVRREFDVSPEVEAATLDLVARIECALDDLAAEHGATAGTINCHSGLRRGAGVAPCLALGRLTTRGVPWSCTGDAVTAVAMLAVKALGGPALYHEIDVVDLERDEAVLANTGEHDLGLVPGQRPPVVTAAWFAGDPHPAPCVLTGIQAGPASLVAYRPLPRPTFVVADGEFTGRSLPGTGTSHASFRFDAGPVTESWAAWCRAGAPHHAVATTGRRAAEITSLAHHLGADSIIVS